MPFNSDSDNQKKTTILLVEDDPFLLSMYATKFELENFAVITADNGVDGLKLAKDKFPDIILLDVLMPRMDGFEVLKNLKADPELSRIPVILLTNLNQRDEAEHGLSLGADDYLIKAHFIPSEVVERVKELLNKRSVNF